MNIIVKNTHSFLDIKNKDVIKVLRKKYSAKIKGYRYSKAFKKGWDGSKYFITEKGKFGTGLLSFIKEDLTTAGISYSVVDERPSLLKKYDIEVPSVKYRPYQKSLILEALHNKTAIIESPTGSGKTVILAGLLQALRGHAGLVFFTQKSILLQTYEFLKEAGFDVGIAFGDGVDIKPLTLCTVQSVEKVLDTHLKEAKFIIFDEVHEFSKGKLTTSVIKSFPNATYRFGMTATVPKERLSKLNLVSYLGGVLSNVDVENLVLEGFLTPPVINFIEMPPYKTHDLLDKTYADIYDSHIVNNEYRNIQIRDLCKKITKGKVLILVKNLTHLQILKDLIPESVTLEGKDKMDYRKETIKNFKKSNRSVLIGTKIMQTGVNIPEITHLINARGLKSEIATIQALGRALRIHESKKQVEIYDFNDKVPYLKEHSLARRRAYKSLKIKING